MPQFSTVAEALEEFSKRDLGNIKVLMIEDDPLVTDVILERLSKAGCVPYSSETGDDAVSLATQFQPDVVILDLMLPGKQGEEVLVELKSHPDLKHIPVVVFSNKAEDADVSKNLAHGAERYLIKATTDLAEIATIVKEIAAKKTQ